MKTSFRGIGNLVGIVSLTVLSSSCYDMRSDSAEPLMQNFSAGCLTRGRWTDGAIAHSRSLINVLETLKNTDKCKPYINQITTVQTLSNQLGQAAGDAGYGGMRVEEETLQELMLALGGAAPGETALISALQGEITSTKVDLAKAKAKFNAGKAQDKASQRSQNAQDVTKHIQSMLSDIGGLSECLAQSPNAALQLATNFVAMGGSFAPPAYGVAMAVIGQVFNYGLEFTRNYPLVAVKRATEKSQLATSLSCAMESMSELYCQAEDARELLYLQAESYKNTKKITHPIWEPIDILGRRLPVVIAWLQKLRNGVIPNDPIEADRQNEVWEKVQKLENDSRSIVGEINYSRMLYNSFTGRADSGKLQEAELIKIVAQLAKTLVRKDGFSDLSTEVLQYACWLAMGLDTKCAPYTGMDREEVYIRNNLIGKLNFDQLMQNWNDIFARVKSRVDIELSQVITVDPNSLLATAFEATPGNVSPFDALRLIRKFLVGMSGKIYTNNPQMSDLLKDTIALIDIALTQLKTGTQKQTMTAMVEIFSKFNLRIGIQFFNDRIGNFVQWDMNRKLRRGEIPTDTAEILLAAGGDIRERLISSGVYNLDLVHQDLDNAQSLTQSNLQHFHDYFKEAIEESQRELYKKALDAQEPLSGKYRPNFQALARLCILTMSTQTGPSPKGVLPSECGAAVLESIYNDPNRKLSLEPARLALELGKQPLRKKMCTFHRFLRAGRIIETLNTSQLESVIEPFNFLQDSVGVGLQDSLIVNPNRLYPIRR